MLSGAQAKVSYLCNQKLWSLSLATGERQLVFAPPGGIGSYSWAPNGQTVAYTPAQTSAATPEVYLRDLGTGDQRLLAAPKAEAASPWGWSKDGAALIIWVYRSTWLVLDPRTGKELGQFAARRLMLSPVSARLAYRRSVDAGLLVEDGGSSSTVVADLIDGKLTERVLGQGDKQQGFTPGLFAEDGTLVYEQYAVGDGSSASQTTIAWWALPPGAGTPVKLAADSPLALRGQADKAGKRLTVGGIETLATSLSPDGQWAMFTRLEGNSLTGVYVTNAGLSATPVPLAGLESVRWDPRR